MCRNALWLWAWTMYIHEEPYLYNIKPHYADFYQIFILLKVPIDENKIKICSIL